MIRSCALGASTTWLSTGCRSGDVSRARDYFAQALAVREKVYPPDAPERINGESYVAYADVLLGNTAAARPVLTRVERVARRVFRDNRWLWPILQSLAELERRDGNLKEAKLLAERAHENGLTTLALTEEGLHHSERAVRILENAIKTKEAELGAESPSLLGMLEALKGVLTRSGRAGEAALIAARADRIRTVHKLPATAGTLVPE